MMDNITFLYGVLFIVWAINIFVMSAFVRETPRNKWFWCVLAALLPCIVFGIFAYVENKRLAEEALHRNHFNNSVRQE